MRLNQLLAGVALTERRAGDVECSGICYDTRTMEPGCLFVALPGYKTDGHKYIAQALEQGAAAVLCQHPPEGEGPWLVTPDARAALAAVSANWFGHPARDMTLLAVTGTNGKTTTTYLLKAMLEGVLGARVGLIGTNQNMVRDEVLPAHRTTPESWEVQQLLREMADAGCTHVVMEASSHALVLHRLDGLRFRAATRRAATLPARWPSPGSPIPSGGTRRISPPRTCGSSPTGWNSRRWPRGPFPG